MILDTNTHTLCYTRIPSDDFQLLQSSSTVMCWSSLCRLLCLLVCCCFMSSIMNCDIGEKQYNRVKIGLFKILLWGTTLKCEDKCHKTSYCLNFMSRINRVSAGVSHVLRFQSRNKERLFLVCIYLEWLQNHKCVLQTSGIACVCWCCLGMCAWL